METLEGQLLLASPQLADPNFVHTVLFLVQHNDAGAWGLVLNRPTGITVSELWKQVGESPCESNKPVHLGGPVSGPVMAIHVADTLAEMQLLDGVYLTAKKQNLDALVRQEGSFKIFTGNAGWGAGQLEDEISQGAWKTLPARAEDIFDASDDLWQRLMRRATTGVLPMMLHLKHVPPDPSLN
jgi:putative transcriptional regulator